MNTFADPTPPTNGDGPTPCESSGIIPNLMNVIITGSESPTPPADGCNIPSPV